jgi:hypothetical protein
MNPFFLRVTRPRCFSSERSLATQHANASLLLQAVPLSKWEGRGESRPSAVHLAATPLGQVR